MPFENVSLSGKYKKMKPNKKEEESAASLDILGTGPDQQGWSKVGFRVYRVNSRFQNLGTNPMRVSWAGFQGYQP